jgi:hypothetical protein
MTEAERAAEAHAESRFAARAAALKDDSARRVADEMRQPRRIRQRERENLVAYYQREVAAGHVR